MGGERGVSYLSPRGIQIVPPLHYDLRLREDKPAVIAMLSSPFPGCHDFVKLLADEMATALPQASFRFYRKPSLNQLPSPMLDDIVDACDALVAAWGH
jgi:hypothetical protein